MKNKLMIIKIGGNIIDQPDKFNAFLKDFATIKTDKILIHGGGKIASELIRKLGHQPKMLDGRRITSKEDLDIVTMVYAGLINKKAVAFLQSNGCQAIGLSGADANCIQSSKRKSSPIDFGYVGDIKKVNFSSIHQLLKAKLSPVFCAITHDGKGQLLNTNADAVAAEIAITMSTYFNTKLIYCFDKKGVLRNMEDENSVISTIDQKVFRKMQKSHNIHAGMLPKMANCFNALANGVQQVLVGNAEVIKGGSATCTKVIL